MLMDCSLNLTMSAQAVSNPFVMSDVQIFQSFSA